MLNAIATVVGGIALLVFLFVLQVWVAMLALGAAHSYDARVPAFGFMATMFLCMAFNAVTGVFKI